tara:strand:- start:227 stop:499 length:273 start_codon:yes stop_codon:yes gene_type:complete
MYNYFPFFFSSIKSLTDLGWLLLLVVLGVGSPINDPSVRLEILETSKSTWKSVISGTNSASVSSDEITEDLVVSVTEVFVETVEALEFKG